MKHLIDSDFNETIKNANKPVLVDFYAEWCQPCKILSGVLDKFATESGEKVDIFKVDIEANPQVTSQEKISSLPTIKVFVNGEAKVTKTGLVNQKQLTDMLNEATGDANV